MSEVAGISRPAGHMEGEQAAAPWCPPRAAAPVWPERLDLPPGVLPRQNLREAERLGIITTTAIEIPESGFQPASLDLLLGPTAYRIGSSFLPGDVRPCGSASGICRSTRGSTFAQAASLSQIARISSPSWRGSGSPQTCAPSPTPRAPRAASTSSPASSRTTPIRFDQVAPGYEGRSLARGVLPLLPVEGACRDGPQPAALHRRGSTSDAGVPLQLPPSAPETVRIQLRPPPQEPDMGRDRGWAHASRLQGEAPQQCLARSRPNRPRPARVLGT